MKATYSWIIEQVIAKKVFTDKNNNVRENVIKDIHISYIGTLTEEDGRKIEKKESTSVSLDLFNLSDFKPIEELSKGDILKFALDKLNSKEKERIEKLVMYEFEDINEESNLITIILNDEQAE